MSCNDSHWWLSPTPLKNMTSSLGMIIPNLWKSIKVVFQTTNTLNKTIWVIRIGDPNWGPTSRKGWFWTKIHPRSLVFVGPGMGSQSEKPLHHCFSGLYCRFVLVKKLYFWIYLDLYYFNPESGFCWKIYQSIRCIHMCCLELHAHMCPSSLMGRRRTATWLNHGNPNQKCDILEAVAPY